MSDEERQVLELEWCFLYDRRRRLLDEALATTEAMERLEDEMRS